MVVRLVLLALLVAPAPVAAQVPQHPEADAKPDRPYSNLFPAPAPKVTEQVAVVPPASARPEDAANTRGPRRKVVCGMTLLMPANEVDPGMVKPKPDDGRDFPIRRYPPPACGNER